MTKPSRIVAGAALTVAVFAVSSIGTCELRSVLREKAFAKVEIGNTREQVVALLGSPDEAEKCPRECDDEYFYYVFMQKWMIHFDKDGKVIEKGYNGGSF